MSTSTGSAANLKDMAIPGNGAKDVNGSNDHSGGDHFQGDHSHGGHSYDGSLSVRSASIVTHDVLNQPPPLVDYDVFGTDAALVEGISQYGIDSGQLDKLKLVGARAGSAEVIEQGFMANTYTPVLRTHDRFGYRVDEVDYHPAWHSLISEAIGYGMAAQPPTHGSGTGHGIAGNGVGVAPIPNASGTGLPTHLTRAAMLYMWSRAEAGVGCPMSMTYAAVRALRLEPTLSSAWEPLLASTSYDPSLRFAREKSGITSGMALTEKQGGSDLRANTTRAEPVGDGGWLLTGHKWFCSAPMSDVFLMLAYTSKGLTCFLLPRVLPDSSRNAFYIQRLKDKLGNKSNASSEIEVDHAYAWMVGEEGRGVKTVVEMIASCRMDALISSAGIMREALAQAIWHTKHREAFGRSLYDQPLMRNVLADIALEAEGATALFLRLARATDTEGDDPAEGQFRRLAVAAGKFWVTKRTTAVTAEALECLGGNGYVEESVMPRLYREAPVNSVWEGSGSVNALDILRALVKEPAAFEVYFDEVSKSSGSSGILDGAVRELKASLVSFDSEEDAQWQARNLAVRLAVVLEASLLYRYAPHQVADAFCRSRLGDSASSVLAGQVFGMLPRDVDTSIILERAAPI
ncbi:MAG: acyl-CoA dehydrogenase family protein [Acidimicrobiales bacterium]